MVIKFVKSTKIWYNIKQVVNLPGGFHLRKEVVVISTYEELMIVINVSLLIVAILTYTNNKNKDTKK